MHLLGSGLVLATLSAACASAQGEAPRLWMSNAWPEWVANAAATRAYADAAAARGLNGVGLTMHWAVIEPAEGQFDFSWLDEQLDIFVNAGLRVHLRLDARTHKPDWLQPTLMQTRNGETYANEHGLTQVSFADENVAAAVVRAYGAIAAHVWPRYADRGDPHPITSLHAAFSPPLETEYVTDEWADFSPPAQAGFRAWLAGRHGTVDRVNDAWGTLFSDWEQITLQAAPAYDLQSYRTEALAGLLDRCADAVHETTGARMAVQFGSIWDGLSPTRGTRDAARLARNADWIIVDDSPVFDFAFSMDYLRGLARDKIWVNEVDGPWNPYLTNERAVQQGIVSLRRGAHALWAANWTAEALLDPKWTFWAPVLEELAQPRPDVRPEQAIFVSLATLHRQRGGGDVRQLAAVLYNRLSLAGSEPVDFLNDTVVVEHPDWLAQYTRGIYIPATQYWVTDAAVTALAASPVPVHLDGPSVAILNEYGKVRTRLPESWVRPDARPTLELRDDR